MEEYQDEIIEQCEMYGIDPESLTKEEMERLVGEIKAEEEGRFITSSILQEIVMRGPQSKPHARKSPYNVT